MREYWTVLDDTDGYYEISNFGKIRNTHSRVVRKLYKRRDGQVVFNTNHNGKRKTILIKRAVWYHFAGQLSRWTHIGLIDNNKGYGINNLTIKTTDVKENTKSASKKQIKNNNWDIAVATIRKLCGGYWTRIAKNYGVEIDDLISETVTDCIDEIDFSKEMIDVESCKRKIRGAFDRLKTGRDARFDDYQIGINYIERDL